MSSAYTRVMHNEETDLSNASHEHADPAVVGPPASDHEKSSSAPRRHWRLFIPILLIVLIAWAIVFFDWNLFKGYVERRVSAATGREFHIDGNIGVKLSMNPLVTMDGLRLGNIPGAQEPTMASTQQLQFRIALWPLLRGQTILPELHLVKPVVLLEKDTKGDNNWTFPTSTANPVIRKFTIDHGVLTYREDAVRTNLVIDIDSDRAKTDTQLAPLLFVGNGIYRNNPFSLHGLADSPLELDKSSTPYRIDVSATAGPTHAHASGALRNPLQIAGFDLDFAIAGPDLALLYRLLGVALPETPPYRLHGRLGHVEHVWSYKRFTGVVGSSDLAGDVVIDNSGRKKILNASLISRRLDVHDLAGFINAPAHANPARAATEQQRIEAVRADATTRLLPQQPYDLERMRGMDADVSLSAQHVVGTTVPLDAMLARMSIKDGIVQLDPLNFGAADGEVQSKIRLDASRPVIAAAATIRLRKINIGKLAPNVKAIRASKGRITSNIDLKGNGNSIAKMLATSNGHVSFGMSGGQVSDLLMAYAGLNIARILKLKITGDHDIAIRCVIGDFNAHEGIWSTGTFVFDSEDTIIRGAGSIDLRDEQLDLLLKPRPKGHSLLSLRSPLRVSGSFSHPSIRPDFKALGVRGIAVAVLGALAPPAAELALIEYGGGKDSNCMSPGATTK